MMAIKLRYFRFVHRSPCSVVVYMLPFYWRNKNTYFGLVGRLQSRGDAVQLNQQLLFVLVRPLHNTIYTPTHQQNNKMNILFIVLFI